jgi:hypothetical protein
MAALMLPAGSRRSTRTCTGGGDFCSLFGASARHGRKGSAGELSKSNFNRLGDDHREPTARRRFDHVPRRHHDDDRISTPVRRPSETATGSPAPRRGGGHLVLSILRHAQLSFPTRVTGGRSMPARQRWSLIQATLRAPRDGGHYAGVRFAPQRSAARLASRSGASRSRAPARRSRNHPRAAAGRNGTPALRGSPVGAGRRLDPRSRCPRRSLSVRVPAEADDRRDQGPVVQCR